MRQFFIAAAIILLGVWFSSWYLNSGYFRWLCCRPLFYDVAENMMRAGVVVAVAAVSLWCAVRVAPALDRCLPYGWKDVWSAVRGAAARFCFWICSPAAVPVLRAVLVAAMLVIALMLVVIACVLVF
jgi:hypothetical protein